MTMKRDGEPNPESSEERGTVTLGKSGPIHLAVCLGITAAVIIALTLVGWLA